METNTYTVLEEKRSDVEKKIKRIAKKAQKYGFPFNVTYGEPYAYTVTHRDDFGEKYEIKYEVFDLTIESETIKKGDYTVLAHLEHGDNGNIVNIFHGEAQSEWVTRKPFCEHCNSNHGLKITFMVSDGKETKQVGRTCLKDYCGIDPQMVGIMNEFYEDIAEDDPERFESFGHVMPVYDTTEAIALAIDIMAKQGYVKSDERDSNKSKLWDDLHKRVLPSEGAKNRAEEMVKAINAMSVEEAVDARLNNVKVRLVGEYCKPSDLGYFAYAPLAYEKHLERIARDAEKAKEKEQMSKQSKYVGTIGERYTFPVKEVKLLTSFETYYGITYLYRFIDTDDNVLIWFASSRSMDEDATAIKATVKDHSERDGVKQTILTRVKVA